MQADTRPIGVFDSGIGGLTVLKHLMMQMPQEKFVYLGDTARVPYGNHSPSTVKKYAFECANFLLGHDIKMIVVACNTVSAVALDDLKESLNVPVIGVIDPAASLAARSSKNNRVGVIGTRATITSDAYAKSVRVISPLTEVTSRACPLFVPLVEEGWLDTPATRLIVAEYLEPLKSAGVDSIVLGCTHFPLLSEVISDFMPGVAMIDCGDCTASAVKSELGIKDSSPDGQTELTMYVTDHSPKFTALAQRFLGMTVGDPVRITLESPNAELEQGK